MLCSFDYSELYTLKHAMQRYIMREQKLFPNDEEKEKKLIKKIEEEIEVFERRNRILKPENNLCGGEG